MHARVRAAIVPALASLAACAPLGWEGDPRAGDLASYKHSFSLAVGERCTGGLEERILTRDLADARVLFLGDHHRDVELHGLQRALIHRLHGSGFELLLMPEAVGSQDTALVARYLDGAWDMWRLRREMLRRWPGSWLDSDTVDTAHYRELLALCRTIRAPVIGLEPTPRRPLRERDADMVARIRDAAAAHPHRLVVVLVGQAHLLGRGDLVRGTGLRAVAIGSRPPGRLEGLGTAASSTLVRTESGLLFFRSLLGPL